MSKSIIQTERQCYVTGRTTNIDRHHLVPGVANRKKAEADGLWVYLYHPLHMRDISVINNFGHRETAVAKNGYCSIRVDQFKGLEKFKFYNIGELMK